MSLSAINLEALEILDAIDRRGSFSSAAEELGKVPSALSYSIQKLEERLNIAIFTRQGRRSVLTPAGKVLLEEGRQLLIACKNLEQEAKRVATGWETRIRIAIETMQDRNRVFEKLQAFLLEHPSIEIETSEEVMGGAWEALIHDRVDLVVGATNPVPKSRGIRTLAFGKMQRVIAVSSSHPLAQFWGVISANELARHRQVIIHDSSQIEVPRSSELYSENNRFYVQSMAMKIEAQRAGIGFGFLPYELIKDYLASGEMRVLNVENHSNTYDAHLAWKLSNRGKGLKKIVSMLTSESSDNAQEVFDYQGSSLSQVQTNP